MLVGRVVGEGHVWAELFEPSLALGADTVGVNHAAHCREVAKLELGDCGADLGDAADDLVSGDAGVDSRHHAAPFVARLVEIGVTNAAIQNFDLYIFRARLTAKDRRGRETRCWSSSSIRVRDIVSFPLRPASLLRARPLEWLRSFPEPPCRSQL